MRRSTIWTVWLSSVVVVATAGGAEPLRFSSHLISGDYTYGYGIGLGDLDRDGDLDIVSSDCTTVGSRKHNDVYWYDNDGRGGFTRHLLARDDWYGRYERMKLADLNGDGTLDVTIVDNFHGHLVWFENPGKARLGDLWKRHAITTGGLLGAYDVDVADFDGDGRPDVVASSWRMGNQFAWYANPGPGAATEWSAHAIDTGQAETRTVAAADFNHDGRPDVLGSVTAAGIVLWYENPGDPKQRTWRRHVIDTAAHPMHGHPVDLDLDGDLDVLMAYGGAGQGGGRVSRGRLVRERRQAGRRRPLDQAHHRRAVPLRLRGGSGRPRRRRPPRGRGHVRTGRTARLVPAFRRSRRDLVDASTGDGLGRRGAGRMRRPRSGRQDRHRRGRRETRARASLVAQRGSGRKVMTAGDGPHRPAGSMTRRARLLASARRAPTDQLPFFHWWRHMQTGWAERECRNRGMGIAWLRPPHVERLHGVEVTEQRAVVGGAPVVRRTFATPVGSVFEDERREAGTAQWHGMRSWIGNLPWTTERLIKRPEDYAVVKYIVEHTEYVADYFPVEQAMEWLGDDGVVVDMLPHSPYQMLAIYWVGSEGGRIFYHLADCPELVEDLARAISRSREPLYEIAARSPAPVSFCGDNVDGVLVSPKLFETYCMPEYEKQARVLHAHGKLMSVHMDGRLDVLKHLIARTPIDIVEAFHPPPMGDLAVAEALNLWPDKAIWLGFPSSTYQAGPEATRRDALDLLRQVGAGDRLATAMSTENQVSNVNLRALTAVLEHAELPLGPEVVARIERATA